MICFNNYSFQYAAQSEPTLRNINLKVERGEKILITGPSGSGKSTLAHCINGLVPRAFHGKSTGEWTLGGESTDNLSLFDFSRRVGTVLQDADGQFVALTAGEDIAFAGENDRVPRRELRHLVPKMARLVRIEDRLDASPQELSGGQKQRVSLAGVLMMEVDILLFDEPLANLDPEAGKFVIEIIDELYEKTGKTIIIIEHRLEEVLHRHIDRIVLFDKGTIAAADSPASILSSGVLRKRGVREPLYISAARYGGTAITVDAAPESVWTLRFDAPKLCEWAREETPAHKTKDSAALSAHGVSFSYESEKTLDDVSFTLKAGECTALAGRNGAGKSTLARLICGFIRPDSGSIAINGEDNAALSIKEIADRAGFVMQNPNQMISFPMIYDEAAFALRARGVNEAEARERVCAALSVCGLYPFRNWPVSALSYGQKKRLTIASIVVTGARLLILDEPTAGQDLRHYTEIMEYLERLKREENLTLLLITHDMHLMLEYADSALVLSGGKLLAHDEPAAVLSNDALIAAAGLKRTSLYDLALRAGIENPVSFIRRFIREEKERRAAVALRA